MAKKDFSGANTGRVYATITEATAAPDTQETVRTQPAQKKRKPRRTYTEQEKAEVKQTLNTTGKKGCALPRINLAFTQPNYDYIVTMSRVSGMNLTEYVNAILQKHREDHGDTYQKAIEFRNSL